VTAFTFWPLALSHIGLRAGSLPLAAALSLAAATWGWRAPRDSRRRVALLALAGALFGLAFYTYLAARFLTAALLAFLFFWYIARRTSFPNRRELAAFGLPAVLVALPLALDAIWQPEILFSRVGDVSILSPTINHGHPWGTLINNILAGLGMFFVRGDMIARHNIPGRPVFDPLMALAFVAGVGLAGAAALRGRRLAPALLLAWTGTMLLPTILAEDTPHFLRAVGVLPAIFLFPALALDGLWLRARQRARWALPALIVAALTGSAAWTAADFFGRYASSPDTAYLYQTAAAELAQTANGYLGGGAGRQVYLDRRFWDGFASVRFLLPVQPGLRLYSEGQRLSAASGSVAVIAWPYEDVRGALQALPAGDLIRAEPGPLYRGDLEKTAYPLYTLYTAEPSCPAALCPGQPLAVYGGAFELLSAAAQRGPAGISLQLVWRATRPDGAAHQVFVQAWSSGQTPALAAGASVVAQADGPLGTALYPSEWWRPNETVLETRTLRAPAAGELTGVLIRVGLYDLVSGVRMPRTDSTLDYFQLVP
jgi:hypothetical protein